MRGFGLLALRLSLGVVYIAHGLQKVVPIVDGSSPVMATMLEAEGIDAGYLVAFSTGIAELFGGALLIAGAYTIWTALLVGGTTLAIGSLLYYPNGFFLNWSLEPGAANGGEFDLLRLGALACLALAGPGAVSFDAHRARDREKRRSPQAAGRGQKARGRS